MNLEAKAKLDACIQRLTKKVSTCDDSELLEITRDLIKSYQEYYKSVINVSSEGKIVGEYPNTTQLDKGFGQIH